MKDGIAVHFGQHRQFEEIRPMNVTMDELFDCHDVFNSTGYTRSGDKSSFCSDFATSDLKTRSKDGEQDRACHDADASEIIRTTSGLIFMNADVSKMFFQLC